MQRQLFAALEGDSSRYSTVLGEFSETMVQMGEDGYRKGALLCSKVVEHLQLPEASRNAALTALALHNVNEHGHRYPEVTEAAVAFFGRFLTHIAAEHSDWAVAWAVSLGAVGADGKLLQPTELVRGVLLTTSMAHADRVTFWNAALTHEAFPLRMCSDPCRPEDGICLSRTHRRLLAEVLGFVSDDAARRVALHMHDHILFRTDRRKVEGDLSGRTRLVPVEIDPRDRRNLIEDIVEAVRHRQRHQLLRECFGFANGK